MLALAALPAAAQHEHEDGHAHDAPGARHLAHGHDGFPGYVDIFFTHHAYLERKLHPSFVATLGETVDSFVESLELAWEFSPRFGGEIEGAYLHTDPEEGDGVSGFGDVEIAPMVALVRDPERLLIVTARSGFVLPTGDEEEGIGIDGWGWEPGILVWKGFGAERRGGLQAEVTYDRLFADSGEDEEELVYNLGVSWWLPSNWIPIVEINGVSPIGAEGVEEEHEEEEEHAAIAPAGRRLAPAHGGAESGGEDLIAATIGFRYAFGNGQQWGAGVEFPLTGTEAYDARVVIGGILHLP